MGPALLAGTELCRLPREQPRPDRVLCETYLGQKAAVLGSPKATTAGTAMTEDGLLCRVCFRDVKTHTTEQALGCWVIAVRRERLAGPNSVPLCGMFHHAEPQTQSPTTFSPRETFRQSGDFRLPFHRSEIT